MAVVDAERRAMLKTASKLAEADPLSDYVCDLATAAHRLGLAMGWALAWRVQTGGPR